MRLKKIEDRLYWITGNEEYYNLINLSVNLYYDGHNWFTDLRKSIPVRIDLCGLRISDVESIRRKRFRISSKAEVCLGEDVSKRITDFRKFKESYSFNTEISNGFFEILEEICNDYNLKMIFPSRFNKYNFIVKKYERINN